MIRRRLLLAGLPGLAALLPGCAPAPRATAVPHSPDDDGIGGTGTRAALHAPDDGGIGGTGVFGSILTRPGPDGRLALNGLSVETNAATLFDNPAAAFTPPRRLPHAGEAVAIEAVPAPAGRVGAQLQARRISVFHPLVGPLARSADGGFTVLGTRIDIPRDTPVHASNGRVGTIRQLVPGGVVAVSGLWRGEAVLATHIARLPTSGPTATVRGLLRHEHDVLLVGASRLQDVPGPLPAPGSFVVASGRPGPAGLVVEHLATAPLAVFAGRIAALSVEGFLAPNVGRPGVHLSGFGLGLDPASPVAASTSTRQVLLGHYRGQFHADVALPLPDDPAARTRALATADAEAAIRRWLAEG